MSGWRLVCIGVVLGLAGCVSQMTGSTYYDGRFWYSNVKSFSDAAGGPRQDMIIVTDRGGRIVGQYVASGEGTFQAVVAGLAAAAIRAAGDIGAGAVLRPSVTNVSSGDTTVNGMSVLGR